MFDIKAKVQNLRKSKSYFSNGYSPAFQVTDNYSTSGRITLINQDKLNYHETADAYIQFLTPEVYPNTMWIGRVLYFTEGNLITGSAVVKEIYNPILKKQDLVLQR